ncbi:MFS transporter [Microbacterium sp. MEC084]|uniref:MFS transporter n=1 Tax=unclassified Microbacterium TaxID=2609290 RepID=UPI0009EA61BA|nr:MULTISPECIES: MFS transporter [unclassified Microbacterium]MCD1269365.1 MFS transporter [Microbacterium sp. MEC084]
MRRPTWPRALRAMNHRNYRLFITGHAVSTIGTWMQRVAQDWLVLELSGSAVDVGIAAALQFLPVLFLGLWGGAVVDRLDRRKLIMLTQVISMILAGGLAVVVLVGAVQLWVVFAFSLALGFVTVFDNPARHAFVAEVTRPQDYVNAQALASTVHNVGRLVGPAIAGVLIAFAGSGWAFAVNALSFVPVLWGLALIRLDVVGGGKGERKRGSVLEGLAYVFSHPELRACMILIAVVALFGQNFRAVLPILASETFHGDAQTYGWLTSALGVGAVIGALITAATERVTGWRLLLAGFGFALTNAMIAVSPWLWLAMSTVLLMGVTNLMFNTLSKTLLQLRTEPTMHGRVMALHGLVFLGTTPIGMPLLGWVCDQWGPQAGLWVASLTALVAAVAVTPMLHRLRGGHNPPPPGM